MKQLLGILVVAPPTECKQHTKNDSKWKRLMIQYGKGGGHDDKISNEALHPVLVEIPEL